MKLCQIPWMTCYLHNAVHQSKDVMTFVVKLLNASELHTGRAKALWAVE